MRNVNAEWSGTVAPHLAAKQSEHDLATHNKTGENTAAENSREVEATVLMEDWIDFGALAQIVLIGLICGAGLPAVFAVGLRALHLGATANTAGRLAL